MKGERASVGIVMLLHDRADVAVPCLRSIASARGEVPWELYLLDNASRPGESATVRAEFERLQREGTLRGRFVRSEVNTGFPKGNNLGIRHFLERDEATHLCLVNSDVLVPDFWLDRLVERCTDAVGPVTNACGNEQTIPVPSALGNDARALDAVNERARERFESFRGLLLPTNFLGFFCFLARIELFLAVGLLDEGFGRGAFEDDDYCLRIAARGFRMEVARDVYVHHWGSSSFSRLPQRPLQRALERNKRRFERKHGVAWVDRRALPLTGAWQDARHLVGADGGERFELLERSSAELVDRLVAEGPLDGPARFAARLRLLRTRWKALWVARTAGRAAKLLNLVLRRRCVLVLGRWFPREEDLSDGYFQRVLAIDGALEGFGRVYLRFENAPLRMVLPRVRCARANVYEIHLQPRNPFHAAFAALLALSFGRIYVHSVLRLAGRIGPRLFALARTRVFDVHGVVPEEFVYEGDEEHAREFGELERHAVERATAVVAVGSAMEEHLRAKYGESLPRVLRVPNVPLRARWEREDPADRRREGVIYAGGFHKWQQVGRMLDYAAQARPETRFTFLVPRPEHLKELYRERHGGELDAEVECVPLDEVAERYREHAFGLALREDVIVNRAACPTKLVEYLQQGLVPIVDSPRVGDFERLGYRYVELGAPLPDEGETAAMRRANQAVVRRIHFEALEGKAELEELFARDRRTARGSAGVEPEVEPRRALGAP